jgi:peroxiredoxin
VGQKPDIEKVFMLPDGNGDFTRRMGMLVERTKHGMGIVPHQHCGHKADWRI